MSSLTDLSQHISEHNDIFLVVGGTGIVGIHVVKTLIQKGKRVRVLVKDKAKFNKVFSAEHENKIESVIECDLTDTAKYSESLKSAFKKEGEGRVSHVISCLGYRVKNILANREGNVIANTRLIEACVKAGGIKKFCLISSSYVSRPFSCISLRANFKNNYMQWGNVLVERILRMSGLNYLIIRPVDVEAASEPNAFTLSQGDRSKGTIGSATVGHLVVDAITDVWILNNNTIECYSTQQQSLEPYYYHQGSYKQFHSDTEKAKSLGNHVVALRLVLFTTVSFFISSIFLSYKYGRKYVKSDKIARFFKRLVGKGAVKNRK
jgi:hypothetical protein